MVEAKDGARVSKGLSLYPSRTPTETRRLARLAEDLGYRNLWFGDSQNIWREAYVSMAASAVDTSRIVIGTGVTNGVTRHRSVIASAWATLNELSGGRVAPGFGVGDSALHTMGARPMRVADLEELVADLRTLWRGDEVSTPDAAAAYRTSYLQEALRIPVYIAASGPKLLSLAGRIADGVILLAGTDPETVSRALSTVAVAAESVGRSMGEIEVVLWAPAAIHEDGDIARDRVRAHVSRTVLRPIQVTLTEEEQEAVEEIRKRYDYYSHMVPRSEHSQLVLNELVDRFALAGTHTELSDKLLTLGGLGVNQVAIIPFGHDNDSIDEVIQDFATL